MSEIKKIALLGCTGSIGKQTLEVVRKAEGEITVELLVAGQNAELLIEQAKEFKPNTVVIADDSQYEIVFNALDSLDIKVYTGQEAGLQCLSMEQIDLVVNAISGFSGLDASIACLKAGKTLALANKESLVAAGEYLIETSRKYKAVIIPIDSEPSAVMQCLMGEFGNTIEKVILTASGGPFLNKRPEELKHVTPEEATSHPVWNMGDAISVDSATLINKGWEVIETRWLFGLDSEQIDVVIHPEAMIHSMVQFEDGSIKAQMSLNDMKIPIQFALNFPYRKSLGNKRLDFLALKELHFSAPDPEQFPCFQLALEALKIGGNAPAVLLGANETAVKAFLNKKIGFIEIYNINQKCLYSLGNSKKVQPEDIKKSHKESVELALRLIATDA